MWRNFSEIELARNRAAASQMRANVSERDSLFLFGFGCDAGNIFGEGVHGGIGVTPRIDQFFGVEIAYQCCNFCNFEAGGARRNQQTNSKLDRWNRFDQATVDDDFEKLEITFAGDPRSEWHEGGCSVRPALRQSSSRAEEICAGVALFEFEQDLVIERFYGAGEKQAAVRASVGRASAWRSKCSTFIVTS